MNQPANPYGELYIYYVEGRVSADPAEFGDAFIGNWEEGGDSFLFFNQPAPPHATEMIHRQPGAKLVDSYRMPYEQWQGGTIAPFKAGRFMIAPPWNTPPETEQGLAILMDPGVVFGTGTHGTTRDCLAALEAVFEIERIDTALDLGTGTGLLAIAASRLGASAVLAVDLNLLAVQTAARNIRLNGMSQQILAVQGSALDIVEAEADLMVANIHFEVMRHLVAAEGFLRKRWFILSGLLRSQARLIEMQLAELPVVLENRWVQNGIWYTYLGRSR